MPRTAKSDASSTRANRTPPNTREATGTPEARPSKPRKLNSIFRLTKDIGQSPILKKGHAKAKDLDEDEGSDSGTVRSGKRYVLRVTNADIQPSSSDDDDDEEPTSSDTFRRSTSYPCHPNDKPFAHATPPQVNGPFETKFLSAIPTPTMNAFSFQGGQLAAHPPTMTTRLNRRESKTLHELEKNQPSESPHSNDSSRTEFLPPIHVDVVDWAAVSQTGGSVAAGNESSTTGEFKQQASLTTSTLLSPTDGSHAMFKPSTTQESSLTRDALATVLSRASQSKYAKASLSILHNPEGLKMYRNGALKTNDPQVQLEFAKYLLELAALLDNEQADSAAPRRRHSATVATSRRTGRSSLDGRIADFMRRGRASLLYPKRPALSSHPETKSDNDRKREMLEEEAVAWIKRLVNQEVGEAAYLLATWMKQGKYGFHPHPERMQYLNEMAARSNIPEGIHEVAMQKERDGMKSEAYALYSKASNLGLVQAIHRMGRIHLHGELDRRQNIKLGLALLAKAAEKASAAHTEPLFTFAQVLANVYPRADIPVELVAPYGGAHAALSYFERAAQLGHSGAQGHLGFIYEHGLHGADVDYAKSFAYYSQAAEHRDVTAMLGLSRLYNGGCHGPNDVDDTVRLARDVSGWLARTKQDEDKAFLWCQKAAQVGLDKALFLLGWYYEIGLGTPRDATRSQQCYKQAADMGFREAQERLKLIQNASRQRKTERLAGYAASPSGKGSQNSCIIT